MASKVGEAVKRVSGLVKSAASACGCASGVRLVAVSKFQPLGALQEAYDAGQRDFGENYVQELVEKAPQMPSDVRWHFIGKLQGNKAKSLLGAVPNLHCVETVDTLKLANRLNTVCASLGCRDASAPLEVMVQLNTSGEASKSGVACAADAVALAQHIDASCERLRVAGLMTIGQQADEGCFTALVEARAAVGAALGRDPAQLHLSMGMSGDFEQAIACGSTNVRVGSTIFGARPAKDK